MKYCLIALFLIPIFLIGCTNPPEKPVAGAGLPACGLLPNCVNSQSGEGRKTYAPIPATAGQWQYLKHWLASQSDWIVTTDSGNFVQAVAKTPLMHFSDDVQLLFVEDAQVIQVRSSSRLGIGDMGANRRRVKMLHLLITGKTTPD